MARLILLIGLFGALIIATSAMSLEGKGSNRRLIQYDSYEEDNESSDAQEPDQSNQEASSSTSSSSEDGSDEWDYSTTTAETPATSSLLETITPATATA